MKPEDKFIGLKRRNLFFLVVLVMLVVLVFPTLTRFYSGNDALIGSESYYHYRAATELMKQKSFNLFSPPEDVADKAYSERDYAFNPYHYVLVYATRLVSLSAASRIVPFLMGILAVLLFNLILKGFIYEAYKRQIILILMVLNPAFIYTFTVSNPHCAAIVLSLLGIYFFMRNGVHNLFASAFCMVIVSLFSLFNALLVILMMLAFILSKRQLQSRFVILTFIMAIFSFAGRMGFFYNYAYSPEMSVFSNLFSDLGGMIGFGIFSIVLAVYGTASSWKSKSEFIYFFIVAIMLLGSLFFVGGVSSMYISFFVAIAAGFGILKLYELPWTDRSVKNLALFILLCGLVFSTVSYLSRLGSMAPDRQTIDSLAWMNDNTFKDGFVLSHYDNGHLIGTVARNHVLTDPLSKSFYDQRFFYKVQDSMFYGRKLNDAKQLFSAYNVKYVYITPDMKSGKVWRRADEGLLFLFTNRNTFEKIYDQEGIEIWEIRNSTVS